MRPAVRTPDAAAAAEHSQLSDDTWHILVIVTATEHMMQLSDWTRGLKRKWNRAVDEIANAMVNRDEAEKRLQEAMEVEKELRQQYMIAVALDKEADKIIKRGEEKDKDKDTDKNEGAAASNEGAATSR